MSSLADQYEKLYPETGCSDAQKQERMERILFKTERQQHGRTGRQRGIIVPALPYQKAGGER